MVGSVLLSLEVESHDQIRGNQREDASFWRIRRRASLIIDSGHSKIQLVT